MRSEDLQRLLRKLANRFGIDVHRHRPAASEHGRLSTMLASHGVNLVLDVGANTGQFARSIREAGYKGRIVSFEPLSDAHEQLQLRSRDDPRWEIAPRAAIGDHEGEVDMYIAGNSVSSSPLAMLESHVMAEPASACVGTDRVPLSRLDTMACAYLDPPCVPFLKIDTQGYEDRVLDGAPDVLQKVCGLQLELSFVYLYQGQQLFDPMVKRLYALGFSIWAIWPGFQDPQSGRMLQADATFFRD
jgi:FkbM family methyltransferase